MNYIDIQAWTNENSGALALLIFIATSIFGSLFYVYREIKNKSALKPKLEINVIEQPTMCSSFDTGNRFNNEILHRTAFLIYLKIHNNGNVPVQIGDIHVGYKSENKKLKEWRWLKDETVLLEDYMAPLGDKLKLIPFLKQSSLINTQTPKTYLRQGEDTNGLVYFEQEESKGNDYPYMDPDYFVNTIIVVHDTNGNKWSVEHRTIKTLIEPIREICPTFGLSRYSATN